MIFLYKKKYLVLLIQTRDQTEGCYNKYFIMTRILFNTAISVEMTRIYVEAKYRLLVLSKKRNKLTIFGILS